MPTHKSEDYKLSAVNYYLTEDTSQLETCRIFKCNSNKFSGNSGNFFNLLELQYNISKFLNRDKSGIYVIF